MIITPDLRKNLAHFVIDNQFSISETANHIYEDGAANKLYSEGSKTVAVTHLADEAFLAQITRLNNVDTSKCRKFRLGIGLGFTALTVLFGITLAVALAGSPSLTARSILIIGTTGCGLVAFGTLSFHLCRRYVYSREFRRLGQFHIIRIQNKLVDILKLHNPDRMGQVEGERKENGELEAKCIELWKLTVVVRYGSPNADYPSIEEKLNELSQVIFTKYGATGSIDMDIEARKNEIEALKNNRS